MPMSGKPLKLARVIRVLHDAVTIEQIAGDRITAGEYDGILSGDYASHNCEGCHFRVRLPQAVRRPIACQILISPLDVTIIPRPDDVDALGLLTRSLHVAPVENHGYWSAALTLNRQGDTVTYSGSALSPSVAVSNAIIEAIRHKAEWFDADPIKVSEPVEAIIDTPHLDPVP